MTLENNNVDNNNIDKSIQIKIVEELKALQLPPKPIPSGSLSNIVIIGGIPCVPQDKLERLKGFLLKNIQSSGMKATRIDLPLDENGQTKGVSLIQFSTPEMAREIVRLFNGREFDKKHTYHTMLLEDYDRTLEAKDQYEEPPRSEFKYKNNMLSWLLQEQCHDQILFNFKGFMINIYEHSNTGLTEIKSRDKFTESHAIWSTCGTYVASMHDKGVALWGGKNFDQITKYNHRKVKYLSFSPRENYLMTYSYINDTFYIVVWNIILETQIREFVIPNEIYGTKSWPQFCWSFDDKYFARKQVDKISVYDTCTCGLLDKKSIDIVGVRDLIWSSNSHFISFWVPETINNPAKVVLMAIPSKEEIFTKNLFNVVEINLHWSFQDEFLAVVGDRYTKKRVVDDIPKYIGLNANLEIYRVQEKEIPVEKIEIKEKRQVVDFQWEPTGSKFAILTSSQTITNLQIFDVKVAGQIQEIKSIEWSNTTKMTMIRWSPKGQHMVIAAVRTGAIEFIDGYDGTSLHKGDHPNLHDLCWDPTGRYVVSYTLSLMNDINECMVIFWNITGKKIHSKDFPGLKQIVWRPRPPCLLSEKKIKEIKKGMGKYVVKFMREDEIMTNETKRRLIETRRNLMSSWKDMRKSLIENFVNEKSIRTEKRKGHDTDNLELGHEKEKIFVLVSSIVEPAN